MGKGKQETLLVVEEERIDIIDTTDPEEEPRRCRFRPVGFLLGLPFALCILLLSLSASIVWMLGALLTHVAPRLECVAHIANKAMEIITLPMVVLIWFVDRIPF